MVESLVTEICDKDLLAYNHQALLKGKALSYIWDFSKTIVSICNFIVVR